MRQAHEAEISHIFGVTSSSALAAVLLSNQDIPPVCALIEKTSASAGSEACQDPPAYPMDVEAGANSRPIFVEEEECILPAQTRKTENEKIMNGDIIHDQDVTAEQDTQL